MRVLFLGESTRGPNHLAVPGTEISRFSNNSYVSVDLTTSGDHQVDSLPLVYEFVRYARRKRRETSLKSTGATNQYRLLPPVVAYTEIVEKDGVTLSLTTSTSPGTSEYYLEAQTGLLILGASYTSVTVSYESNIGGLERVPHPYTSYASVNTLGTISWSALATLAYDEYWLKITPQRDETWLVDAVEAAGLSPSTDYMLAKTNEGTSALCTITTTGCTIVLVADPGPDGNLWKAIWDTDCIHILRAPGYQPRRWIIPLSEEAAVKWGELRYPVNDEDLALGWGHMISSFSGTLIGGVPLTPGSLSFSGGSIGSTVWSDVFSSVSTDIEAVFAPLGGESSDIIDSINESVEDGFWPLALIGSTSTAATIEGNERVGLAVGSTTYANGYVGTPLPAVAGAVVRGAPYYLPTVVNGPTTTVKPAGVIFPFKTVRNGWMLTYVPMTSGNLMLNHHIWLQEMAADVRKAVEKYLGSIGITPVVIAMDADFQNAMYKYEAEYQINIYPGKIEISLQVSPPGIVSEVNVRISVSE